MSTILSTAQDPRIAFSIGSLDIRWYGLIIVFAMLLGLLFVCRESKKVNLTSDDGVELFLWVIPLAVIFARVLYVIPGRVDEYFPWNSWDDFVNAIAIWDGGITIIGGIFGGILGGIFFTLRHRKKVNFGNTADLVVIPLLTGQIIGRLGNFVNQEAFGLPITNKALQTFPFGVYITDPSGVSGDFEDIVNEHILEGGGANWFCATFFYEMVWNSIGLCFCLWFWEKGKNKKYPGFMLIFYFFWYCLGRFWLEFLRIDAVPITKVACGIIAPIALIFGVLYIILRNSQESYRAMRKLAVDGKLDGAPLTEFDVKNYVFVGKVLANAKNPLRIFYVSRKKKSKEVAMEEGGVVQEQEYVAIDFENTEYYHVPKHYKRIFKNMMKNEAYSLN